jgi:hypothetical protein
MTDRESKLRMGVLEALAAITPFLSRETVLDKAGRDTHLVCSKSTVFLSAALAMSIKLKGLNF